MYKKYRKKPVIIEALDVIYEKADKDLSDIAYSNIYS